MHIKFFIRFFILLILISCKDKEVPLENVAPKIAISSPSPGSHFNQGEVMTVEVRITDEKQIHMHQIQIKDLSNNDILFDTGESYDNNTRSITFNLPQGISTSETTNYLITAKATDVEGQSTEKTVQVSIN